MAGEGGDHMTHPLSLHINVIFHYGCSRFPMGAPPLVPPCQAGGGLWLHSQTPLGLPRNAAHINDVIRWLPLEGWQALGRLGPGLYGTCADGMTLFSSTRGNAKDDSQDDGSDCWLVPSVAIWFPAPSGPSVALCSPNYSS